MALKVYSDRTKKFYDTTADAARAEAEFIAQERKAKEEAERKAAEEKAKKEAIVAERKADATRVEEKIKVMRAAQRECKEEIDKFVKKHGTYHWSSNSVEDLPVLFDNFFSPIFKAFL